MKQPNPFFEYWRVFRENWLWVVGLASIGLATGWWVATLQRPLYQAKLTLDIRSLNENFLNSRDAGARTTDSVLPESYIQTEIKILQSDALRKRALDRIKIPAELVKERTDDSFWRSPLEWLRPRAIPMKDLIADAGRRVKVRAVGNTRIVEVYCDARDGQAAATICNTLARTYIENNLESREASTKETSEWLQSQLDDVRKRLTKSENDLNDAAKATDYGFTAEVGGENPAMAKLRELQMELSRSESDRMVKDSNYVIAANKDVTSLPSDLYSGPIREYQLRLTDAQRQLAEARSVMTPEHPKVRELTMQVAELQKALQNERKDLVSRLRADLDTALRRESMISAAYDAQAKQVLQREDKAVRYNMIKRDVDSERQLYGTLLQRVDEVGLAAALHTSTISVVDAAIAPLTPYSPNVPMDVGIGFLGGGALGLAFALFRVRSDNTFRAPGESAMYLQLRELGVIPSLRGRSFRMLKGARPTTIVNVNAPGEVLPVKVADQGSVVMKQMPARTMAFATWLNSPEISEAIFGAMNSLITPIAGGEKKEARVFVVTSPDVGDGKTTVATNLATALANIGQRVVLVDGDMRKPGLHSIFDENPDEGLAKLLDENSSIPPLTTYIRNTEIPNLYLIPTKAVARGGVIKKLHSRRLRALVELLRSEFDIVIIDSPPMRHISDARVYGRLADGLVLVFRSGKTTRESALAVYDCLVQDGIRVLGTILNDWSPRQKESDPAYSPYLRAS